MAGATYNITRFTRQVLKRYRKEPPSLVLHLYQTHFRFEQQHGNFNYDSPMKCFLEAIREQKLPTELLDVLDEAEIRYYEGCLIVEVHDHRAAPVPNPVTAGGRPGLGLSVSSFQLGRTPQAPTAANKAEVYRIVLGPNPATLWTELGIMDKRRKREMEEAAEAQGDMTTVDEFVGWSEEQAVQIEAVILNRTTAPLCLSPSLQTSRIANSMLNATTLRPPKRKRWSSDAELDEDGEEGARHEREDYERMMKLGDEGIGRGRGHAFARLAFIQAYRERQNNPTAAGHPSGSGITSIRLTAPQHGNSGPSTAAPSPASTATGAHGGRGPYQKKNKAMSAAADSDAGTPGPAGSAASAAASAAAQQNKKAKKLAAQQLAEANDPTLPLDPVEREKELDKRKKAALTKKRAEAKLRKERKASQQAAALQANDLQVGTPTASNGSLKIALPGGAGAQARF